MVKQVPEVGAALGICITAPEVRLLFYWLLRCQALLELPSCHQAPVLYQSPGAIWQQCLLKTGLKLSIQAHGELEGLTYLDKKDDVQTRMKDVKRRGGGGEFWMKLRLVSAY